MSLQIHALLIASGKNTKRWSVQFAGRFHAFAEAAGWHGQRDRLAIAAADKIQTGFRHYTTKTSQNYLICTVATAISKGQL